MTTATPGEATAPTRPQRSTRAAVPALSLGRHLPALDGLRGLAILLVIANHLGPFLAAPFTNTPDFLASKVVGATWNGVDLFFVLSGFLITGILADSKGGPGYFRNFYVRRTLRIFPLYYAFLFAIFVVLPLFGVAVADAHAVAGQRWYWTYLSNVRFAHDDAIPIGTGHLWSLAVEEQFYLVWPLVVLLLPRRKLIGICLAIIGVLLVGRIALVTAGMSWVQVYVLTPTRIDTLAMGALLALVAREAGGVERLARWARPTLAVSAAVLASLLLYKPALAVVRGIPVREVTRANLPWDVQVQTLHFTNYAFFFGALLVLTLVAARGSLLERVFGGRVLRFFGRYSYAIYLFHVPLAFLAERRGWENTLLPRLGAAGYQLPRAVAFYLLLTAASTLLALVSWHLFEKHFLRLKDRFAYRTAPAARAAALETEAEAFASP